MHVKKIITYDGLKFYYPDAEYLDNFVADVLEGKEYPILHGELSEVRVCVDIGAHVGATLRYLMALFPAASFYGYEPNPISFELLKRNVDVVGGANVRIKNIALGPVDGELQLYFGKYSSMQASLLPNEENAGESVQVPVRQAAAEIDSLCGGAIDLLKLDTEGMELPIMESLGSRLSRVKYILLEYHSDADRLEIESRLLASHSLYFSSVFEPDRGTLCYILREHLSQVRAEHEITHYAFPKPGFK